MKIQDILCNDCDRKGTARFHWLYHKCGYCGSYNTRVIKSETKNSDCSTSHQWHFVTLIVDYMYRQFNFPIQGEFIFKLSFNNRDDRIIAFSEERPLKMKSLLFQRFIENLHLINIWVLISSWIWIFILHSNLLH